VSSATVTVNVVSDHHITVGSLQSGGYPVTPLYSDLNTEDEIINYCFTNQPNVAVFGGLKPSAKILICLGELNIPRIYLWWDHTSPQNQQLANTIDPFVDLHVVMDMPKASFGKFLHLWYPLDQRLFYSAQERDIDVCFLGTVLPEFTDRIHYLSLLEKAGYKIYVKTGIYRDNPLTIEEYAGLLRRSKIALNFTMLPQYHCHQYKTRTAEILHCGAMLLESKNEHTPKFFTENEDFVFFDSIEDLIAKINYYLSSVEREKIAFNGCQKVKKYNENVFWDHVFKKCATIK
jgi:spore maturation protein CgeB